MKLSKPILLILLGIGMGTLGFPLEAQRIKSMDFRNQNIVDILMVLAEASGTSIIPDETVEGKASFHFTDASIDEALELFLSQYKLFHRREGNSIRVSRIDAFRNGETGKVTLRSRDTDVESLVKALSRAMGLSIIYDALPKLSLSLDIRDLEPPQVMEIIMKRLAGYELEMEDSFYYIHRSPGDAPSGGRNGKKGSITREGDLYTIKLDTGRFLDTLSELFHLAEKEYSILTKNDSPLDHLYFAGKTFDELLRIILEQGSADYTLSRDIYYITELQKRDVLKKLKETRSLVLQHISAQDFPALLPADYGGAAMIRLDKNSNTIFLTGTPEEIEPIAAFAALVDQPLEGLEYRIFNLKYRKAEELIPLIPGKLLPSPPQSLPGSRALLALGSPQSLRGLESFLSSVDLKQETYPVPLRFIKIEELLKNLPPSVESQEILDSGYPNLIFFTGSEAKRSLFMRELSEIDKPKPQLRYELLVVEYSKSNDLQYSRNFQVNSTKDESAMSLLGNLSNLMNLSFNVIAQFGYQFAASLNLQLGNNTAQVYADTTLNGLSGQEIRFQNTDTYRYQEFEVDADTGKITRTGVTREISSGLIVALNGWVSGDDMITMNVNATVSKQNNNHPADTSGLPGTSERIVNTQIRTPSGKPIVLSGLMKDNSSQNIHKFPLLGDIPILNLLFRDDSRSRESSEIVIYIVPYLVRDGIGEEDLRLERYYKTLVEKQL